MNYTILIIEDETRIAEWIQIYLERADFHVEIARDGREGLGKARTLNPDLIILDLMLPYLNGMELCRILRRESEVPIIMLTAKGARDDRIKGLDGGADDYIVKPFDPDELVERVKAVLRRSKGKVRKILTCGHMTLDENSRDVFVGGEAVKLSHAQFAILAAFMHHPNILLTRSQLIELAFNNDFEAFDRAIDTHIRRLRKLINRENFEPIQTIYGAGYKLLCSRH